MYSPCWEISFGEMALNKITSLFRSKARSVVSPLLASRRQWISPCRNIYRTLTTKASSANRVERMDSKVNMKGRSRNRMHIDMKDTNYIGELNNEMCTPFKTLMERIRHKKRSDKRKYDDHFDWINNPVQSKTYNKSFYQNIIIPSGSSRMDGTLAELYETNKLEFRKRKGITEFNIRLLRSNRNPSRTRINPVCSAKS